MKTCVLPRSGSGGEDAEEGGGDHLLKDFPHAYPHHLPHHHRRHYRRPAAAAAEDEEGGLGVGRGRRWSTGDRMVPHAGRGESPPLPFISDSHSIVGGYEDSSRYGGLGYQRTLRFAEKQPLQVCRSFCKGGR